MADKPEAIGSLEHAWEALIRLFDVDGDGCVDVEELILILDSCHLFDGSLTQRKVRNYFKSLHSGEALMHVGYRDFKNTLQWVANMKGMDLEAIVKRVIILSKRLVVGQAAVSQRLHVVFDSYSKSNPEHMSAFEFGELCQRLKLPVCFGDIFLMFSRIPGGVQGKGVDFQGFIRVIRDVGDLLKLSEDVMETFAKATALLDNNPLLITRIKMRMRQSATAVMDALDANWLKFFEGLDLDGSGSLDWDEFLLMARTRLHLDDKKSHLRMVFEAIDVDGSDEVSLKELADFLASD